MNNTPELLSPAGDLDKMRFGIAYGADAVYMAGTRFGMRAAATNFDDNALREGIAYAHAHGVKCYITVNIMPSNRDLPALPAYLELPQTARTHSSSRERRRCARRRQIRAQGSGAHLDSDQHP